MPTTYLPPFRSETYDDGVMVASVDNFTVAEYAPMLVAYVKEWAGEILAKTDWYTIKAFETGTAIPSDINAQRAAVRAVSNEIEGLVMAATTGEELDAIPWAWMLSNLDPATEIVDPT